MIGIKNDKIKVLVVDDSAFMRKVISDILSSNHNIEVVDTARNGNEAIEKARKLNPDIITLDIEMPVKDGLEALSEIIQITPTPKVIMLSSLTKSGADQTMRALELGAVDFITKPGNPIVNFKMDDVKDEILDKVMQIASLNSKAIKRTITNKNLFKISTKKDNTLPKITTDNKLKYIVAIGTSTGGPRALQDVIPLLPDDIPAAILVVQHMPPGFTKSLADRLNNLSKLRVKEAEDGDILRAGYVYIAPGDYHMVVNRTGIDEYSISTNKEPQVSGHRPSVNVMMESVAKCVNKNIIAVMMTGMGNDGSEGMRKIKQMGGITIAQDEASCVVYGMPKAVVNTGIVDSIVPLNEIASEIVKYMGV